MAYPTFEKYDFYTKPETEDYSFTKHMIAQTAAENNARNAQNEKDKQDKKEKLASFTTNAPYENDNNYVNQLAYRVRNSAYDNNGQLSPQALKDINEATVVSENSKIQSQKAQDLRTKITAMNTENPAFNKNLAEKQIYEAENGEGVNRTNRGAKLSELESRLDSHNFIDPSAVYASYLEKRKGENNVYEKTRENSNTGFTNTLKTTTKAPFRTEIKDENGNIIGHKPEVTDSDVQAFIGFNGEGGGGAVYKQELDKLQNNPSAQEMLNKKADDILSKFGGGADETSKQVVMASLIKNEAENAVKKQLELQNNALASIDQTTSSTYKPTLNEIEKSKNKGEKEKYKPITTFDTNKSIGIIKAAIFNPKTNKPIGKTKDVTYDINYTTHIDNKNPDKPLSFEIKNNRILNPSNTEANSSNKENSTLFIPTTVENVDADINGNFSFGTKVKTGKNTNIIKGNYYDVTKMKGDGVFGEFTNVLQSDEDKEDGKLEPFTKYKRSGIIQAIPSDYNRLSNFGVDMDPHINYNNKSVESKPKVNGF